MYECEVCNLELKRSFPAIIEEHNNSLTHLMKIQPKVIGSIYCYTHNDKQYIGSTFNLEHRKFEHNSRCFNPKCRDYNYPFYKYIRNNKLTFVDLHFEVYETIEIDVLNKTRRELKNELEEHEQNYMYIFKPVLNFQNANGIDKQKKKERQTKKVNCPECNLELQRVSLSRHLKYWCKST
jgi:hypothetical protein